MADDTGLIPAAVSALTERALEVRSLFAQREQRSHGREWTPAELMSGFVVDVGDLTRLVMAKTGSRSADNLEEALAHELADCLWSVLVLADRLEVDLAAALTATMDELEDNLRAQLP